jgi:phosphonate transport system substrate-binding protein
MEAVDRANAEVFAQMVNADGTQGYYSHLIVNKDSPIKTLDDMLKKGKDLSFGNGDPNSTSGFLVPSFYVFAQNKIDARTFFKVSRSGNHESNALAVANKQIDVATNNSENLEKLKGRLPEKFNDIRVIWTSPLIALDPLVMRKDLPEATKQNIKDFFFTYGSGGQQEKDALMKLSKLSGFKASTNAQLVPIRQLELFKEKNKVETDTGMTAAEKTNKIAEINQKIAALGQ